MHIHIQLVPIPPPPNHLTNSPDPPALFHYTTGLNLRSIITSGQIKPSTAHVPPDEKPVVWFSTSRHWEPTATKCSVPGSAGQLITAQAQGGLVRIGVPASTAPHRFEDLPLIAGTKPSVCIGLLIAGLELGSDPDSWRFTLQPVPTALFLKVEFYDFANDGWLAIDMAELVCRN